MRTRQLRTPMPQKGLQMHYIYDEAHQVIAVTHPKYIFKYCRITDNLIASIASSYLWFSRVDDFNDPFEFGLNLEWGVTDDELRTYVAFIAEQQMRKIRLERPVSLDISPDEFVQNMIISVHSDYKGRVVGPLTELFRSRRDYCGVCCFSEIPDNALMWAHYANNFAGACLVFDFLSLVNPQKYFALEVSYVDARPPFNYIKRAVREIECGNRYTQHDANFDFDREFFGTKLSMWEYEKEYRLVSFAPGVIPFQPSGLVGILLGSKVLPEDASRIHASISSYPSHVYVEKIEIDVAREQINVHKFDNYHMSTLVSAVFNLIQTCYL